MASGPFSAKVARDSLSLYTVTLYPKGSVSLMDCIMLLVMNLIEIFHQYF